VGMYGNGVAIGLMIIITPIVRSIILKALVWVRAVCNVAATGSVVLGTAAQLLEVSTVLGIAILLSVFVWFFSSNKQKYSIVVF
jgi:hypothetical protein